MKHIFGLCIISMLFLACDTKEGTQSEQAVAPENQITNPANTNTGSIASPVTPNLDIREARALAEDWWVIEFWIDDKNPETRVKMRGHWFKFEQDGTFTSGYWADQTANGVWHVGRDQGRVLLTLDSSDDSEDMQFDMQGITADSETMSWVGTKEYDMAHNLCKAIKLSSRPTEKQFDIR